MQLQIINGTFSKTEALDLITQMVGVKIKFHEDRIGRDTSEEDCKMREAKIKHLQNELAKLKHHFATLDGSVDLKSLIEL